MGPDTPAPREGSLAGDGVGFPRMSDDDDYGSPEPPTTDDDPGQIGTEIVEKGGGGDDIETK
jgi:hypothetical protein